MGFSKIEQLIITKKDQKIFQKIAPIGDAFRNIYYFKQKNPQRRNWKKRAQLCVKAYLRLLRRQPLSATQGWQRSKHSTDRGNERNPFGHKTQWTLRHPNRFHHSNHIIIVLSLIHIKWILMEFSLKYLFKLKWYNFSLAFWFIYCIAFFFLFQQLNLF